MDAREVKKWDRAEWERARARGKGRFVLRYGILGFGFPLFLVMLAYFYVAEPMIFEEAALADALPVRWSELARMGFVLAILSLIGGSGFAVWLWRDGERRYPPGVG